MTLAENRAKAAKGLKMSSFVRGPVRAGSHMLAGLIQTMSVFEQCEGGTLVAVCKENPLVSIFRRKLCVWFPVAVRFAADHRKRLQFYNEFGNLRLYKKKKIGYFDISYAAQYTRCTRKQLD